MRRMIKASNMENSFDLSSQLTTLCQKSSNYFGRANSNMLTGGEEKERGSKGGAVGASETKPSTTVPKSAKKTLQLVKGTSAGRKAKASNTPSRGD